MFEPTKLEKLLDIQDSDLSQLPKAEDERYEYKSSAVKDSDLKDKIIRAASGFWNSGGGLFVVGVGEDGRPDGGLSLTVGTTPRRDWIDQAISRVTPSGLYKVQSVEGDGAGLNIEPGKAVFLIGFGKSEIGPHMAADNRYYIRAGAHTAPASHFIVEAIHARRGLRTPLIRHIVRRKPGNSRVIQLGIIALSAVPAINVSIKLNPLPIVFQGRSTEEVFPSIPIISEQYPFFFDIQQVHLDGSYQPFFMDLTYFDATEKQYNQTFEVDINNQLGPNLSSERGSEVIEKELKEIKGAIKEIAEKIGKIKLGK